MKCYYVTQAGTSPPKFVFFVNDPRLLHFSYQRYLENTIREAFGFAGTPYPARVQAARPTGCDDPRRADLLASGCSGKTV